MALRRRSFRKRGSARRTRGYQKKSSSAATLARKAIRLATSVANSTTEVKYALAIRNPTGLATNQVVSWGNAAFVTDMTYVTSPAATWLYKTTGLNGNKAFLKYIKCNWNYTANNEEEPVTTTVTVVSMKSEADAIVDDPRDYIANNNGIAYFDPRRFKVHYRRVFTIYPGGELAGDRSGGQMAKDGRFFIPVNKMIRHVTQGITTPPSNSSGSSIQDRFWLVVHTSNFNADLENPLFGYNIMTCWRDNDSFTP